MLQFLLRNKTEKLQWNNRYRSILWLNDVDQIDRHRELSYDFDQIDQHFLIRISETAQYGKNFVNTRLGLYSLAITLLRFVEATGGH